jgi:hypothetical protein
LISARPNRCPRSGLIRWRRAEFRRQATTAGLYYPPT